MKNRLRIAAMVMFFALTAMGAFVWGFQTHRNHWFPYQQLLRLRGQTPGKLRYLSPRRANRASVEFLPYVSGTRDSEIERSGVLTWDRDKAWTGTNVLSSFLRKEVQLIDMGGRTIHRWRYPGGGDVVVAVPLPNGDLLGLEEEHAVFRLDRHGNELWRYAARAHHAIEMDDRGHIWTLTRGNLPATPQRNAKLIEDFIVELTPDGQVVQSISVLELLEKSPFSSLMPAFLIENEANQGGKDSPAFNLLHVNHVEVFDGSLEDGSPLYKRGNFLVSMRNMNAIMIVDGESREILWFFGPGYLFAQHHSQLLENGNILVFNNGVERSSIVEVDPRTDRIVWTYAPDSGFFSNTMGSCQRLPNGNTMVTDSSSGYVFEVTPEGTIVWKFANPDRKGDIRMAIYRFMRYPTDDFQFLTRR